MPTVPIPDAEAAMFGRLLDMLRPARFRISVCGDSRDVFPTSQGKNGSLGFGQQRRISPGITCSPALADRAKERRALSLTQGLDGCTANPARLTLAAIHETGLLKVTGIAFGAHVIAQGTAAGFDGSGKRFPDGGNQLCASQQ